MSFGLPPLQRTTGTPPFYDLGAGRHYAYHDAENHRLVLALGQDTAIGDGTPLAIDREDEMFRWLYFTHREDRGAALAMYFRSGLSIWESCRQLLRWRFGNLASAGRLLDFACGHGRVTRFAVHELGAQRVEAAEIEPAAVTFVRREFGIVAHQSSSAPEAFDPGQKYSAILVSSLFTHLPKPAFLAWLQRLGAVLAEDGLLLVSLHDLSLLPPANSLPEDGVLFTPHSESRSLPGQEYGTTWVSETAARELLHAALPHAAIYRLPRACGGLQDFYVAATGAGGMALPPPALPPALAAHIDTASVSSGRRLTLQGWCADRRGGPPPRAVEMRSQARVLPATTVLGRRPEADALFASERLETVGFHIESDLPKGTGGELPLSVVVVCHDGAEAVCYEGTVAGLLLLAVRIDLERTARELEEAVATRDQEAGRVSTLTAELAAARAGAAVRPYSVVERLWRAVVGLKK